MIAREIHRTALRVVVSFCALAVAGCTPGGGAALAPSPYSANDLHGMTWSVYYAAYEPERRVTLAREILPATLGIYEPMIRKYRAQYGAEPCGEKFQATIDLARALPTDAAHAVTSGKALAEALKACRASGLEQSKTPALQAAGKDLTQMADGSLFVVAISMVAAGAAEPGAMVAREAEALLQIDSRGL